MGLITNHFVNRSSAFVLRKNIDRSFLVIKYQGKFIEKIVVKTRDGSSGLRTLLKPQSEFITTHLLDLLSAPKCEMKIRISLLLSHQFSPFFVYKVIIEIFNHLQLQINQMQYCRVEQPVILQEVHISSNGSSHCSPSIVVLFRGGSHG